MTYITNLYSVNSNDLIGNGNDTINERRQTVEYKILLRQVSSFGNQRHNWRTFFWYITYPRTVTRCRTFLWYITYPHTVTSFQTSLWYITYPRTVPSFRTFLWYITYPHTVTSCRTFLWYITYPHTLTSCRTFLWYITYPHTGTSVTAWSQICSCNLHLNIQKNQEDPKQMRYMSSNSEHKSTPIRCVNIRWNMRH
jgi:hypothetical protein